MSGKLTAGDVQAVFRRRYQHMLDKTVVHIVPRWLSLVALLALYALRVYLINGWYIVSYGLGIYLLNMFIGFISPQMDPEGDGPLLPINTSGDEYRPFNRKVPEFQFWHASTRATIIATLMTFFKVFDVPVFWPILLIYFFALFAMTMKNQLAHMMKYKYVPFTWGKKKYAAASGGKKKGDREGPSGPPVVGGGGGGTGMGSTSVNAGRGFQGLTQPEPRFTGSNIK